MSKAMSKAAIASSRKLKHKAQPESLLREPSEQRLESARRRRLSHAIAPPWHRAVDTNDRAGGIEERSPRRQDGLVVHLVSVDVDEERRCDEALDAVAEGDEMFVARAAKVDDERQRAIHFDETDVRDPRRRVELWMTPQATHAVTLGALYDFDKRAAALALLDLKDATSAGGEERRPNGEGSAERRVLTTDAADELKKCFLVRSSDTGRVRRRALSEERDEEADGSEDKERREDPNTHFERHGRLTGAHGRFGEVTDRWLRALLRGRWGR